jgi:hypothetical protein
MTTERQRAANRTNAKKSSGPKSSAGRNRSSQNARRHGLTAPPPWDDVAKWYRTILDNPGATPDPMAREAPLRAAFSLAEAEARLEQVRREEEAFFLDPDPGGVDAANVKGIEDDIQVLHEFVCELKCGRHRADGMHEKGLKILERLEIFNVRQKINAANSRTKTTRLLSRYRAEAEAQRSKALRHWIDVEFAAQSA